MFNKFTAKVTHPTDNENYGGVHTFKVNQSNHNKKYHASADNFGCSADIYDTPEQAIDYLIQAQACTRVSEIKEVKEEMENKLEEIKETATYTDLKENMLALNNLKSRIHTEYVTQRISGLNTQITTFMKNAESIKSFSHSVSNALSLIDTIKTQYDYNEIEVEETWVLNKLGSLIRWLDYDIKDLRRKVDELL
jgi:hypothetical protein